MVIHKSKHQSLHSQLATPMPGRHRWHLMRHGVLGNGGFTELSLYGRWTVDEQTYVRAVRRYVQEVGNLVWAAPQDWMCEQHILRRTGLTVLEHQRRTVANFVRLRDLAADLPFIPVLQGGETVSGYQRCAELYQRAGVDLESEPVVGIGTVCRRQHTDEVERIMRALAAGNLRLHGFGVKTSGLARYAEALSSSDSMAWSFRGRHVPGCGPSHRTESNCLRFALGWHRRVQEALDDREEAAATEPGSSFPARAA